MISLSTHQDQWIVVVSSLKNNVLVKKNHRCTQHFELEFGKGLINTARFEYANFYNDILACV